MSDTNKFVQAQTFTLAGSGAVLGATSITLNSFQDIEGVNLTLTDFGTLGMGTLEPGGGTNEEAITFSGVTQNANGTATLTGVKNQLFKAPYTQTSGLAKTHTGGAKFIITNTAGFYDRLTAKGDDETITGTWTFTNPNYPRMDTATPAPTDNEQLAPKKYVDDIAIAGSPDATLTIKGIVEIATTAEINSGTATGGTGASIVARPDQLAASIYGLQLPSSDQKAALAGTSGTPSVSNKYVTNDDVASVATSNKVARRNSTGDVTVNTTPTATTDATSKVYVDSKGTKIGVVTTPVIVASSTSETDLISISIPAATLGTANAVKATVNFNTFRINGNSETATFRLKYGSTTVATMILTEVGTGSIDKSGKFELSLIGSGATNSQVGNLYISSGYPLAVGDSTAAAPTFQIGIAVGTAAEDSTGALTMKLTVQFSQNNANTKITMQNAIIDKSI